MLHFRTYNPTWIASQPIAHRGLHDQKAPENSLAAFEAAVVAGYAIELDVQLSSDRQLVVIHDSTTQRSTPVNMTVKDSPADELTCQELFGTHQTIPLLTDVLKAVRGRVPLLIDVKKNIKPKVIGPILCDVISNYPGEVAIASFDPRILLWLRHHARHIPQVQIAGMVPESDQSMILKRLLMAMPLNLWTRPDFIAFDLLDFPDSMLSFWVRILHIPVILYTIKTRDELELVRKQGRNMIFDVLRP